MENCESFNFLRLRHILPFLTFPITYKLTSYKIYQTNFVKLKPVINIKSSTVESN